MMRKPEEPKLYKLEENDVTSDIQNMSMAELISLAKKYPKDAWIDVDCHEYSRDAIVTINWEVANEYYDMEFKEYQKKLAEYTDSLQKEKETSAKKKKLLEQRNEMQNKLKLIDQELSDLRMGY